MGALHVCSKKSYVVPHRLSSNTHKKAQQAVQVPPEVAQVPMA